MKRPIVIKSLVSIKKAEFNRPSIWRVIKLFFQRKRIRRLYSYLIIAEVDSLKRVGTTDVILGQNNTAWIVRNTGYLTLKYGESPYVEIISLRPYSHCQILGNCLVVARSGINQSKH